MSVYNYPAPRYPDRKEPTSVEECLPAARAVVQKLAEGEKRPEVGVAPRFYTRAGSKFLIVTTPEQNKYIAEAVTQVLMENGAAKVDFIYSRDLGVEEHETFPMEEGWREGAVLAERMAKAKRGESVGPSLGTAVAKYLDEHLEYSFVCGGGGPLMYRDMGRLGHKWNSYWPYDKWERFLCEAHYLPMDVWLEVENRMLKPLADASEVRITDPEGTHVEYSLTPEQGKRFSKWAMLHGHLYLGPIMGTADIATSRRRREEADWAGPIAFAGQRGVLAGCSNHAGFMPYMQVYFDDDRLVKVKGGGKYGDIMRELMDRYKNVQLPTYPGKGLFWYAAVEVCTSIGAHRLKTLNFMGPNGDERNRMGVMHGGPGAFVPCMPAEAEKHLEIVNKIGFGRHGHLHFHNYFWTFEIKIRGTDYWYKILDKGWVTALDDPVVRAMTRKYGDPDEILKYDWIPPLPGINCEGDYWKDYAQNPVAYLKKRVKEGKSI